MQNTTPDLPARLQQTLDLLLAGDSEKQVARKLALSKNTVHVYITKLFRRFNVSGRSELMAFEINRLRQHGGQFAESERKSLAA